MTIDETTQLYSTREAADLLRLSQQTVRNYIRSGVVPAVKLGERRGYRLREEDVFGLLFPAPFPLLRR